MLDAYQAGETSISTQAIRHLASLPSGQATTLRVAGVEFAGSLVSREETDGIVSLALDLNDGLGRFQLAHRPDGHALGVFFFQGEELAFRFRGKPQGDSWALERSTVSQLLCSKPGSTYPLYTASAMPKARPSRAIAADEADDDEDEATTVVSLSSLPESTYVLYIDFDGETFNHPWWTGEDILEALPHERAFDSAFVTRVWRRVCEDFAAFDINVTTDRSVFNAAAIERRVMVICTPSSDVAPSAGGVAYLNTFGMNIPCWAFNPDEGSCADTISHEVGHTVGLLHDGKINVFEYYGGHGTGKTSWAPIMGAYFADLEPPFIDEELTTWSKGEYPDATNQEDDLEIITTQNGFTYRRDDHGNSPEQASDLMIDNGRISDKGIIGMNTDSDWFQFSTSGGELYLLAKTLNVNSPDHQPGGANLAINLSIFDNFGNIVASSNQKDQLDASVNTTLRSGTYFARVRGGGRGDLATGFTKYSSLGEYTLSGSVPQAGVVRANPRSTVLTHDAQSSSFDVVARGEWKWSSDADWIFITVPRKQNGNQTIPFAVTRNGSKESRSAAITITSGPHVARLQVTQAGVTGYDDHPDVFTDATLISQDSTTQGVLETAGDVDTFRIEITDAGYLHLRTSGETDTSGTLFDATGRRLATNGSRYGDNFGIRYLATEGIYYLQVSHSSREGIGAYSLIASMETAEVFTISDTETLAGPSGGNFAFDVYANGGWRWQTSANWITSSLDSPVALGSTFLFTVAPNPKGTSRRGTIVLFNDTMRLTHTVNQGTAAADDHANTTKGASVLRIGKTAEGVISYEGDIDFFRLSTRKSGLLLIQSHLRTDLTARLLDSKGVEIARNDDADTSNFTIRKEVSAGEYFLEIRNFDPQATGIYEVTASLDPSDLVDLAFRSGPGGRLRGPRNQTIVFAGDARTVTAVPNRGYRFLRWSDGVRTARRSDSKVISHMSVRALFEPVLAMSAKSLRHVDGSAQYSLAFGNLNAGRSVTRTIRVRNQGETTLSDIRIQAVAGSPSDWALRSSSLRSLRPGQSAEIRLTCSPSTNNARISARYRITAQGLAGALTLEGLATVGNPDRAVRSAPLDGTASRFTTEAKPVLPAPVPAAPALAILPDAPWIEVSPDGYFRYRFTRASGDDTETEFEISANGIDWEDALVLDIWKTEVRETETGYEAILAPPVFPAPRILVNERIPAPSENP